jgi:hypothetical protein
VRRRSSLCWICPKRSSVSAMYADVEPVPPSPRSKKRMSGVRVDKGHDAIKMLGAAAARVDRGHDAVQKQGPEEGAVTRSTGARPTSSRSSTPPCPGLLQAHRPSGRAGDGNASEQAAAVQRERATARVVLNCLSLLRIVAPSGWVPKRENPTWVMKRATSSMPTTMSCWLGKIFSMNNTQRDLFQILVVVLIMGWKQPKNPRTQHAGREKKTGRRRQAAATPKHYYRAYVLRLLPLQTQSQRRSSSSRILSCRHTLKVRYFTSIPMLCFERKR